MNTTIFISMLFCLQLFYWFVGRWASKEIQGKEDYFLAGKNVRLFPLMMTFLATQVGGGAILGASEEAYHFGWPVLLYPLGMALGLILLGSGIGRKLAQFQISTVAQIFDVVYGSVILKKIASILSIISLFMILVAQLIGSLKFLISMGLSSTPLFILFWSIVILYTAQGGLRAVIFTDMIQAAFFSIIFLFCFGFVLLYEPTSRHIEIHGEQFADVSSKLCGWLLMPLLFMVIEQDMGQRCFAGASPRIVSQASFLAGVCTMIVCIIPVFFGLLAHITGLEIPQGGSVLMAIIAKTTNPWITALVGCAVLAAIVSTVTSLINAISSNVANDFSFSFFHRIDSRRIIKGMTCLISFVAIFFTFYFDNIVDVLIQSYELSVSCLFIPVLSAIFRKQGTFLSALMAMLLGAFGFILFRIFPIEFPKEIASILFSFFGYGSGEIVANLRAKVVRNQG